MADDLNGKVAIVTGGARDIGRAISIKFGALGASVVVNYNDSSEEVRKHFPNTIPLGREGEANEVAAAVAFLAGDASTYITGEALQINGGIYFI